MSSESALCSTHFADTSRHVNLMNKYTIYINAQVAKSDTRMNYYYYYSIAQAEAGTGGGALHEVGMMGKASFL